MAIVAACSTGGHNIGEAYETIKRDDADVIIAGGAEAPIVPVIMSAFTNMRGLASDNANPTAACKPFDVRRDGFVLSEGAGRHPRARVIADNQQGGLSGLVFNTDGGRVVLAEQRHWREPG